MHDRRVDASSDIADRINAERIELAGWTRAILMQMAHPLIAAGVIDHSSFRESWYASVQRLHHTVRAMLALTFGGPDVHASAIEGIRAIHRRVNGRLRESVGPFPAGTPYSAEDPDLVLWVHATLIDSAVLLYDTLVAPLSTPERDAYCQTAASVAIELGARPKQVPIEWAALERYIDTVERSGVLTVGADARAIAAALLRGHLARIAAPIAWVNEILTAGWLSPDLRAQYGLRWDARRERQFHRLLNVLRRVRRAAPDVIAIWPEARKARSPAAPALQA